MNAWWEIRNQDDDRVCGRSTQRECRELLAKYVTEPPTYKGWSRGPYSIWRVTESRRVTYRPRPATQQASATVGKKGTEE